MVFDEESKVTHVNAYDNFYICGCGKNGALKNPTEGTKTNTGANVTENSSTSPNGEVYHLTIQCEIISS